MTRKTWIVGVLAVLLLPAVAQAKLKVQADGRPCVLAGRDADCARVLYAGQNTAVGEVLVDRAGTDVTITFKITNPGWTIIESHVYAAGTVPTTSAPGQFPYKHEGINTGLDVYVLEDVVPAATDCLYVATHAVVAKTSGSAAPDLDAFAVALPESVSIRVAYPGSAGVPSYFDTTVWGGGTLDGTYDGWCVDMSRNISPGDTYTAKVYSSYEGLPAGVVDKPENLDLVNWIINQDFSTTYTWEHVQCAIWHLVDDSPGCPVNEGVAAILEAAQAHEGFAPQSCQDKVAVVLVPVDAEGNVHYQVTIAQVTVIEVGDFCDESYDPDQTETAWGCGDQTFRTGWGSYFTCGGTNCVSPLPVVPAKLSRK